MDARSELNSLCSAFELLISQQVQGRADWQKLDNEPGEWTIRGYSSPEIREALGSLCSRAGLLLAHIRDESTSYPVSFWLDSLPMPPIEIGTNKSTNDSFAGYSRSGIIPNLIDVSRERLEGLKVELIAKQTAISESPKTATSLVEPMNKNAEKVLAALVDNKNRKLTIQQIESHLKTIRRTPLCANTIRPALETLRNNGFSIHKPNTQGDVVSQSGINYLRPAAS